MATRKQLAALAKARAARRKQTRRTTIRRCRTTKKRTGAETEESKFKTLVAKTGEKIWSAMKSFGSYVKTTGIDLFKNTSLAALNTFRKQSARLTYIKILLDQLMKEIDEIEQKPSQEKLDKLDKNADILIKLIDMEAKENNQLPKRFVREVNSVPGYIEKLRDMV